MSALGSLSAPIRSILHLVHVFHTEKTAFLFSQRANPALNLAPFSRWTLRDKAAQRRLALR